MLDRPDVRPAGACLSIAIFFVLALVSCTAPITEDVAGEIVATAKTVIGKPVLLKTSLSLKAGSLSDAADIWVNSGWAAVDAVVCKDAAPLEWGKVDAFELRDTNFDLKTGQLYTLRICATQLSNPKRVAAIGVIVSSQKSEPYKP